MKSEDLKAILELQELDTEIGRVSRRLKDIEKEKEELQNTLESLKKELLSLRERVEELTNRRKDLREEIEREEELLTKTEDRMMRVRKDSEYKSLLREKARHEDNILKRSYELDTVEEELRKARETLSKRESVIQKRLKDIEEELEDIEIEKELGNRKLKELQEKRKEHVKTLKNEVIEFYERAKEVLGDAIVVSVEEGVCGGCGMKVPSVLFSKLIKSGTVEKCPNCGRYIYYVL